MVPVPQKPAAGTLRLANYVEYWWPRGENWGIYNCRTVHGSSSLSLHAGGREIGRAHV